jgi:hypothetical protein
MLRCALGQALACGGDNRVKGDRHDRFLIIRKQHDSRDLRHGRCAVILIPSLTRLPARCYKRVLCAEVCSPINGQCADAQVFRCGQIGTPL